MARVSDYAARTARAQAAGYASLSAQRTAQAHQRGFTSRAAETISAKQPTVSEVLQHYRNLGFDIKPGAEARMARRWSRATYKKLGVLKSASAGQIRQMALDGDPDAFYH